MTAPPGSAGARRPRTAAPPRSALSAGMCDSHGVIVNLTWWTSVEALADFVFAGRHVKIMRRRREWFARAAEAMTALWWVQAGHRPTTEEAEEKIRRLRVHGPTPEALTFRRPFPSPDRGGEVARSGGRRTSRRSGPPTPARAWVVDRTA
jgi:hypothetical protein